MARALGRPARTPARGATLPVAPGIGERRGGRASNALYGNRQEGETPEVQDELGAENLALAARAVGRIGGTVLVEPVSGAPAYPLKTAADAVRVIDRVAADHGETNLGLLFDVYHLAVNGDDVDAALSTYRGRIAHVQVADAPGRGEPGTGDLPIERWTKDLRAGGYDGWIGLEYKTAAADPFAWLPAAER